MARILIIDDDPDIVQSMKAVLESKQYEVDSAHNGTEGIKKAKLGKPDVIVLDVMMDDKDEGFEVARVIRKDDEIKHIPILMLTAIKEKTGFDFSHEAGDEVWLPVDDYCEKPLNPKDLIQKIEALIQKKRS